MVVGRDSPGLCGNESHLVLLRPCLAPDLAIVLQLVTLSPSEDSRFVLAVCHKRPDLPRKCGDHSNNNIGRRWSRGGRRKRRVE